MQLDRWLPLDSLSDVAAYLPDPLVAAWSVVAAVLLLAGSDAWERSADPGGREAPGDRTLLPPILLGPVAFVLVATWVAWWVLVAAWWVGPGRWFDVAVVVFALHLLLPVGRAFGAEVFGRGPVLFVAASLSLAVALMALAVLSPGSP